MGKHSTKLIGNPALLIRSGKIEATGRAAIKEDFNGVNGDKQFSESLKDIMLEHSIEKD